MRSDVNLCPPLFRRRFFAWGPDPDACYRQCLILGVLFVSLIATGFVADAQQSARVKDARNVPTGNPDPYEDPDFEKFGIYAATAPRAPKTDPVSTRLPLKPHHRMRIGLIGNMLLERSQYFGYLETLLQQRYPEHELIVRHLGWPADEVDLQPRPDNFADIHQHLYHEKIDLIIAAYGFNESFAGIEGLDKFKSSLTQLVQQLKTSAFNDQQGPQIVLLSPIACENVNNIAAADENNANVQQYAAAIASVAADQSIGFIDLFESTRDAMQSPGTDLTINGVHLNDQGYALTSGLIFKGLTGDDPPKVRDDIRQVVLDKNRQFFRRYRPLNTFYYTGGRSKSYGYLDFLPAMRNFEILTANRDRRIWDLAQGKTVPPAIDDSNVPPLPETKQSRGANRWMTAEAERAEFDVDPRFEVNLFAGEEQFPDIAAPIQMRWDSRGRLWVSCSTTYPHVYPGNEPNDRIVILEDTDGDGRADKSTVFADDLHIPLSFELGDGGVYVSEEPHLTFLKDTDGDGKADVRRQVLSGFGTEDSHHALHDFVWSPDGDLLIRESIFHHSQIETAYGPVRQQNSGWFRFHPDSQRLISFGTYHSTNPWGVTFDRWGQHVASHPIFAAAFHSLDPPYPTQHPKPTGLRAYSGTCGQEFVDFDTFPKELHGGYIKARYKPTNRIEIHRWVEGDFGYDEQYVGDLIFSRNLSFIPVDVRFGPRGALYVCDWYNPVKGHAQYSLRDERRDRHSGRIWRITAKGHGLQEPMDIAGASIDQLLDALKRPEGRVRYWVRRELRERDADLVADRLDAWVDALSADDPEYRHHQIEAIWVYRGIGAQRPELLRELLACEDRHARAAATQQLRYWHGLFPDAIELLRHAVNDPNAIVRMEGVIAASYIGTKDALDTMLQVLDHPHEGHLAYAITCALGSHTLRRHWEHDSSYTVAKMLRDARQESQLREPTPSAPQAQFDTQSDLATIRIAAVPEVMRFDKEQFTVKPGQPVKLVFSNPDATDHNLVIVQPGAVEEVGMAANEMAKNPKFAQSDFIPEEKRSLIMHATKMIGPTRSALVDVLRFIAPSEPGVYPYVCTFPGHWVVMQGVMVVAEDDEQAERLLADARPKVVKQWQLSDFDDFEFPSPDPERAVRGMTAFVKANCHQCHMVAGHGVNLGPDLNEVSKKYRGAKLLKQLIEPSSEINEKFQTHRFLLTDGRLVAGVIKSDQRRHLEVMTNLLTPDQITKIEKDSIELQTPSTVSAMPTGLLDVLTKQEIADLLVFLESDKSSIPGHHDH